MSSSAEAGWWVEGEAILNGLTRHQYELVTCVELPCQLEDYLDAAESDPRLEEDYEEWRYFVFEHDLVLPIEQSCDRQGLLLHWDMRAVRLRTLPSLLLSKLHFFFDSCPCHIRALLSHAISWLVRFERVARRGSVAWTVADVVIPDDEGPSFRASKLRSLSVPRRLWEQQVGGLGSNRGRSQTSSA